MFRKIIVRYFLAFLLLFALLSIVFLLVNAPVHFNGRAVYGYKAVLVILLLFVPLFTLMWVTLSFVLLKLGGFILRILGGRIHWSKCCQRIGVSKKFGVHVS